MNTSVHIESEFGTRIDEAVFLLSKLNKSKVLDLEKRFPELAPEFEEGVMCGAKEEKLLARAQVILETLEEVIEKSNAKIDRLERRIGSSRKYRFVGQLLVLIGSTSVLGSLARGSQFWAAITGTITALASGWNLYAEHVERILNPKLGNIYDLYQKLSNARFKAISLKEDISIALKYETEYKELKSLIANGNALCLELGGGLNWFTNYS